MKKLSKKEQKVIKGGDFRACASNCLLNNPCTGPRRQDCADYYNCLETSCYN